MKEQILKILAEHPNGMRLREIAGIIGAWNPVLVQPMSELEAEGKIFATNYHDPAQMERYKIWKIK